MSRVLEISDQLFERLDLTARTEGLDGIEELLAKVSRTPSGADRQEAVAHVRSLRQRLQAKYGEMSDSTELIREDRDR